MHVRCHRRLELQNRSSEFSSSSNSTDRNGANAVSKRSKIKGNVGATARDYQKKKKSGEQQVEPR